MNHDLSRRTVLAAAGATGAMFAGAVDVNAAKSTSEGDPFSYCLNTSTIRGKNLDIVAELEVTAKAGYDGIEIWLRKLHAYVENGGKLSELRKRIEDLGLTVESAIGFARWIVDDDAERAKGLEEAKRDMDALAQIGAKRIAAPPAGATREPGLDLFKAAERYRKLLEIGDQTGVVPQVEIWGPSANLHRLGEAVLVAVEADHPKACLLPDVYHIFRGGSGFEGLGLLAGDFIQVFHFNDYPAEPPRTEMNDSHRVYPGDGVAPITSIIEMLLANGSTAALSLELFNRDYWAQDPLHVAKTGLAKMKNEVRKALA